MLLACADQHCHEVPRLAQEWIDQNPDVHRQAIVAVILEKLRRVAHLAELCSKPNHWTDGRLNMALFFGEAVSIGVFCPSNGFIRSFSAFDFLFCRLFGGHARPFIPALFVSSLLHPDFFPKQCWLEEGLSFSMAARIQGYGSYEPSWSPDVA